MPSSEHYGGQTPHVGGRGNIVVFGGLFDHLLEKPKLNDAETTPLITWPERDDNRNQDEDSPCKSFCECCEETNGFSLKQWAS